VPIAANPTLDTDIYDERGFELNWEGHRRQDMIRFGNVYLLAHGFVPAVGDCRRLLFAIPTAALNTNPIVETKSRLLTHDIHYEKVHIPLISTCMLPGIWLQKR
jgi:hypothetical protein